MASLNKEFLYDFSPTEIFKQFSTDECFRMRLSAQGASEITLLDQNNGEFRYSFVVARDLPNFVPSLMRKKLSKITGAMKVIQTEKWFTGPDGMPVCEMQSQLEQLKIRVYKKSEFELKGAGTLNRILMRVDCDLPVIGNKLADYISDDNSRILDAEYQLLNEYLKECCPEQAEM